MVEEMCCVIWCCSVDILCLIVWNVFHHFGFLIGLSINGKFKGVGNLGGYLASVFFLEEF